MKILVCIKQVPESNKVEVDPVTGVLKRDGAASKMNPYDLYALETAFRIREEVGGSVHVISMGPPQAQQVIREAFAMGADGGTLLSDRKFGGADVLATSYTLAQGIKSCGDFDLILCGKQTTDGDTAQVGPAIAEHLTLPHAAWVAEITGADESAIRVRQDLVSVSQESEIPYPCLITVDKDMCVPRLPSYLLKKETAARPVRVLTFEDLSDQDLSRYGLIGSPTAVVRMFAPPEREKQVYLEGDAAGKTDGLFAILTGKKII